MAGKIRVFDRKGHIAKLCIVVFPLLVAALIGVSRVDDYWHHWQDVFAGGLLGLYFSNTYNSVVKFFDHELFLTFVPCTGITIASFCYLQFFPPPYDVDGTPSDFFLTNCYYMTTVHDSFTPYKYVM